MKSLKHIRCHGETPPVVWQPVFTNFAERNGNWSFTIIGLTNYPAGYYRAVAQ